MLATMDDSSSPSSRKPTLYSPTIDLPVLAYPPDETCTAITLPDGVRLTWLLTSFTSSAKPVAELGNVLTTRNEAAGFSGSNASQFGSSNPESASQATSRLSILERRAGMKSSHCTLTEVIRSVPRTATNAPDTGSKCGMIRHNLPARAAVRRVARPPIRRTSTHHRAMSPRSRRSSRLSALPVIAFPLESHKPLLHCRSGIAAAVGLPGLPALPPCSCSEQADEPCESFSGRPSHLNNIAGFTLRTQLAWSEPLSDRFAEGIFGGRGNSGDATPSSFALRCSSVGARIGRFVPPSDRCTPRCREAAQCR
jgi:hypothetical protein